MVLPDQPASLITHVRKAVPGPVMLVCGGFLDLFLHIADRMEKLRSILPEARALASRQLYSDSVRGHPSCYLRGRLGEDVALLLSIFVR